VVIGGGSFFFFFFFFFEKNACYVDLFKISLLIKTYLPYRYLENKMYTEAIALISTLLKELKRLDDKNALMEVQLLESRAYHSLRNLPKSRVC